MAMVVRTNYSALNATRHLNKNQNGVAGSIEKLSSGFKVNRAADDASGLAISEKMKAQIKALETAVTNAEDGIGLIQTTEGYLDSIHTMLNRMVTLAEKAANGIMQTGEVGTGNDIARGSNTGVLSGGTFNTYDNKVGDARAAMTDRDALQAEMNQLCAEIDRVAATANFNKVKLFDGNLATKDYDKISTPDAFGVDKIFNSADAIADVARIIASYTSDASTATLAYKIALSDAAGIRQDAYDVAEQDLSDAQDLLDIARGIFETAGGVFATDGTIDVAASTSGGALAADLTAMGDALTDFNTAMTAYNDAISDADDAYDAVVLDGLDTLATDLTTALGVTVTTDDAKAIAAYGALTGTQDFVNALAGEINAELASAGYSFQVKSNSFFVQGGQIEGKTLFTINTFSVNQNNLTIFRNEGTKPLTGDYNTLGQGLTLQIGETSNAADKLIMNVGRMNTDTLFANLTNFANNDNDKDIRIDINSDCSVKGIIGYTIDISGQQRASAAADGLNSVINKVSVQRAELGAMQNRLDYTIDNLNTAVENVTSANSRIRDTDMAKEMTKFTMQNVLLQSAQSMLAQANAQPQNVLSLLR